MPKAAKPKASAKDGAKKKDPDAPKRPLTAYMLFAQEKRPEVKAANPDATFGEMGKLIGAEWKKLDDSEKKKYQDRSNSAKAQYDKEKGTTKKKASKEEDDEKDDEDDDE